MKLKGVRDYLLYLKTTINKTNSSEEYKKLMTEALNKAFLDGVRVGRGQVVEVEV